MLRWCCCGGESCASGISDTDDWDASLAVIVALVVESVSLGAMTITGVSGNIAGDSPAQASIQCRTLLHKGSDDTAATKCIRG